MWVKQREMRGIARKTLVNLIELFDNIGTIGRGSWKKTNLRVFFIGLRKNIRIEEWILRMKTATTGDDDFSLHQDFMFGRSLCMKEATLI